MKALEEIADFVVEIGKAYWEATLELVDWWAGLWR